MDELPDAKDAMLTFGGKLTDGERVAKRMAFMTRWLKVLVMRNLGYSWEDIGFFIDRCPGTVRRLHAYARRSLVKYVSVVVEEAKAKSDGNRKGSKFSGSTNLPGRRKKRKTTRADRRGDPRVETP